MTDESPNYSRNIVARRLTVTLAAGFGFVVPAVTVWVGVADWFDDRTDINPNLLAAATTWSGIVSGIVTGVLTAYATGRIHRHFWPEHPDEK
ncbi:MAG: hypothetical protein MUF18_07600 [Fimbriiglobus sp.]|nr:hypothetical protein [Fimbriiglobus sp.]